MKYTINFSDFVDAFYKHNREKQFSYDALRKLYDYYSELEADTGEEIELDVIAICCDWTEYANLKEAQKDFDCETIEELENNTTVLHIENSDAFLMLND